MGGARLLSSLDRFRSLEIWDEEDVRSRLAWYHAVSTNAMPAKYLICRRISCEVDLKADEAEMWKEHDRLTPIFLDTWKSIRKGEIKLSDLPTQNPSLLDLNVELANRMLIHCNFCRWNCRVDRSVGTKHGTCQLESVSRVGSYFHHRGEEIVFRGTAGSGTIFFTSCNLRCGFCQNSDISRDKDEGIPITPEQLALMAWQLRMEGCHNINLVGGEPTIHLHTIMEAISLLGHKRPRTSDLLYIEQAKSDDLLPFRSRSDEACYAGEFNVPILWNSNFFMSQETMRLLRTVVDVWLPDFKFGSDKCAVHLARTPWYFETVAGNHELVHGWGEDYVIRHLIMPNHVECCTKPVLRWIAENLPGALVNVMDQYHPDCFADPQSQRFDPRYREIARHPTEEEILESFRYAKELGLRFEPLTYEKNMTGIAV